MKNYFVSILTISFVAISSCTNNQNTAETNTTNEPLFSELKDISEFEATEFIPTLEHKISNKKNAVYCVTLLYAWNEIRKKINEPLEISKQQLDLTLLNESTTFEDVLKSNDYRAFGEIDGELISARAEFHKSLPFATKLQSFKNKLIFDKQKVASFGIDGNDKHELLDIVQIMYYKDNDNFILKLIPKDKGHEILLFKSENKYGSLIEMNTEIERLIKIGKKEKENQKLSWKYYYAAYDEVVIPKFSFNIETNYPSMEGNTVSTKSRTFQILKTWQRTAFVLDESGAKVQSEAEIEFALEEEEQPKPKKMYFDKPFLILLKQTESEHPYFGLWVANSELMIKE
jgi:hypothetical protein